MIEVTIPGQPPSVNRLTELHNVRGVRQKAWSAEFYEYRDLVTSLVQRAMPRGYVLPAYLPKQGTGMLVIEIWLLLARDMDCDNILKPLLDGVKLGLGTKVVTTRRKGPHLVPIYDDAGFLPRFIAKRSGVKDPQVYMRIWALT